MKTESTHPPHSAQGTQRTKSPVESPQNSAFDPFAQLLADLQAQDGTQQNGINPDLPSQEINENAECGPMEDEEFKRARGSNEALTPQGMDHVMQQSTTTFFGSTTATRSKVSPSSRGSRSGINSMPDIQQSDEKANPQYVPSGHDRQANFGPDSARNLNIEPLILPTSPGTLFEEPRQEANRGEGRTSPSPGVIPAVEDPAGQIPTDEAMDFDLHVGQALGETFEAIGAHVSLWAAGKSQRASFSVESGLNDPLAVELTLNDGVAQLAFRTDDSSMRQLLQAQAPTALAEALTRAGLTLGGFSVGSQGNQEGQQRDTSGKEGRGMTTRVSLTPAADRPDAVGLARARAGHASGAAGLDVYA